MSHDNGTVGLLGVLGGLLIIGATAVAGSLVAGAVGHARVDAAADMVALGTAAVLLEESEPCRFAEGIAARNDVGLAECRIDGLVVSVTVVGDLPAVLAPAERDGRASARAELRPAGQAGGSGSGSS